MLDHHDRHPNFLLNDPDLVDTLNIVDVLAISNLIISIFMNLICSCQYNARLQIKQNLVLNLLLIQSKDLLPMSQRT